jgi:heat shock protein HslJ
MLDGNPDRVEQESGSWDYSSDRAVMVLKSRANDWSWFAMPTAGVLRAIDSRGNSIGLRTPADLTRVESAPTAAPASPNGGTARQPVTFALSGPEWKLTELESKPVRPVTKTQRAIVLVFDEDSRTMSGVSGCNQLDGSFDAGWRTLSLKPRKSLRVCLADAGTERAVSRTIKATRTYRITGTTLDLFDEQGARIARLEGAAQPAPASR